MTVGILHYWSYLAFHHDIRKEDREFYRDKIIKKFKENTIKTEKLSGNNNLFAFRLNDKERVISIVSKYEDKESLVILEILPNHEYHKSKYLKSNIELKELADKFLQNKDFFSKITKDGLQRVGPDGWLPICHCFKNIKQIEKIADPKVAKWASKISQERIDHNIQKKVTALYWAVQHKDKNIVELLLKYGADVNAKTLNEEGTPLFMAAENGYENIVNKLIEAGADVNAKTEIGEFPLLLAIHNRHTDIVQKLIEAGADVNATDNRGAPPLFRAVSNKYTDIVQKLIEAGADVNATDNKGTTPIFLAISDEESLDAINILIKAGATVLLKAIVGSNSKGEKAIFSPLELAQYKGYSEMAKLLRDAEEKEIENKMLLDNKTAIETSSAVMPNDTEELLKLLEPNNEQEDYNSYNPGLLALLN